MIAVKKYSNDYLQYSQGCSLTRSLTHTTVDRQSVKQSPGKRSNPSSDISSEAAS